MELARSNFFLCRDCVRTVTASGAPFLSVRARLRSSHSPAHRVASSAAAPMLAQKLGPEVMLLVEAAALPAIAPPPKGPAWAAAEALGAAPGVARGVAEAQAAAGGEGEFGVPPGVLGALPALPAALLAVPGALPAESVALLMVPAALPAVLGALPAVPAEPLRRALSVGVVAAGLPLEGSPCACVPEAMGVVVAQSDRLLLLLLLAPTDRVAVGEAL